MDVPRATKREREVEFPSPVGEGQGEGGGECPSNIHINTIAMQFHQIAPRLRLALAHQLGQ